MTKHHNNSLMSTHNTTQSPTSAARLLDDFLCARPRLRVLRGNGATRPGAQLPGDALQQAVRLQARPMPRSHSADGSAGRRRRLWRWPCGRTTQRHLFPADQRQQAVWPVEFGVERGPVQRAARWQRQSRVDKIESAMTWCDVTMDIKSLDLPEYTSGCRGVLIVVVWHVLVHGRAGVWLEID